MITPSHPPSGTVHVAVTVWGRFFTLTATGSGTCAVWGR